MDHILATLQCNATLVQHSVLTKEWNHDGMVDLLGLMGIEVPDRM